METTGDYVAIIGYVPEGSSKSDQSGGLWQTVKYERSLPTQSRADMGFRIHVSELYATFSF